MRTNAPTVLTGQVRFVNQQLESLSAELRTITQSSKVGFQNGWLSAMGIVCRNRYARRWNRRVFSEVFDACNNLAKYEGVQLTSTALRSYFTAIQAFEQTLPAVDVSYTKFFDKPSMVRVYMLPTYVSLLEGCMSNCMRVIASLLGLANGKNYESQKNLSSLKQVCESNDIDLLTAHINVDLRNAIDHGGVWIDDTGSTITYRYNRGEAKNKEEMGLSDLLWLIDGAVQDIAACILSIGCVIGDETIPVAGLLDQDVRDLVTAFEAGNSLCRCTHADRLPNNSQINLTYSIASPSWEYALFEAERVLRELFPKAEDVKTIWLSFSHTNLAPNFVRASRGDFESFGRGESESIVAGAVRRGDCLWVGSSTGDEFLAQPGYTLFPSFESVDYCIYDVEDVSAKDRKRLKAKVFVANSDDDHVVRGAIRESIDWVAKLATQADPRMNIKHGEMKADCVYLYLYCQDDPSSMNMASNNTNFICMVEYCPKRRFRLSETNGFTKYLYSNKEEVGFVRIYWRDGARARKRAGLRRV